MPIANLMILEGRAPQDKQALIRAVTTAIVETLRVKPESVRVILQEVSPDHWGIGGVSARELGR
jgi:4-oxalocrotonate tautomerase